MWELCCVVSPLCYRRNLGLLCFWVPQNQLVVQRGPTLVYATCLCKECAAVFGLELQSLQETLTVHSFLMCCSLLVFGPNPI